MGWQSNAGSHIQVGRVKGASGNAVASAAYRTGKSLDDETTGRRFHYGRRDIASTGMVLPRDAPAEWRKSGDITEEFWNAANEKERNTTERGRQGRWSDDGPCAFRRNSVLAIPVHFALPASERPEVREKITRDMAEYMSAKMNTGVEWAVHSPPQGSDNWHAHLLVPSRELSAEGFGPKSTLFTSRKTGTEAVYHLRQAFQDITNSNVENPANRIDVRALKTRAGEARERGEHTLAASIEMRAEAKRGNPRQGYSEYLRGLRERGELPARGPAIEAVHHAPSVLTDPERAMSPPVPPPPPPNYRPPMPDFSDLATEVSAERERKRERERDRGWDRPGPGM